MPLGVEVSLSPGDFVLDGDPAPSHSPKRTQPSKFRSMSLVAKPQCVSEYHLVRGRPQPRRHCVRWGPSYPSLKGHSPQFSANVRCGQTAGWTKMPLYTEIGLCAGNFVFDGTQLPPPEKKHSHPPNFWPMSIVAKRLDGSRCHFVRR